MSIRRNTFYNLLGSFLPLLVSLVTIPIYIGLIGESRYGVLAIVWLLLGYFGIFDLGLGRATAQKISALRDAPAKERAQLFWTALSMNVGLGIVGGLLIWPFAIYFFQSLFKIEVFLQTEIQHAIPWLILAVPMAIVSGTLSGALQGRERFFELNLISISGTALFQLLPLAVAQFYSIDLNILLPVIIFTRLLTMLALFERCKRHIIFNYSPYFSKTQARQLLHFGGWVTVTSFVSPMMVILDRFIIGAIMGAKAVTYYTVPFQLAERTRMIPGALTSALFPRLSAASREQEKLLADESMTVLVVIMTPIILACILFIEPFLTWWVGSEFADKSTLIGQIMLMGFWVNGLASIPYAQLQARGKPALVAKCHLFELIPYLLLLYFGLNQFGLPGAAVAFALRGFVDFVLLAALAGGLWQALRLFIIPALLFTVAVFLGFQESIASMHWWAYVSVIILISLVWAGWKAPDSIKASVLSRFMPGSKIPKRKHSNKSEKNAP